MAESDEFGIRAALAEANELGKQTGRAEGQLAIVKFLMAIGANAAAMEIMKMKIGDLVDKYCTEDKTT